MNLGALRCPEDHQLMFLEVAEFVEEWRKNHPSSKLTMPSWDDIAYLRCLNGICRFYEIMSIAEDHIILERLRERET